MNNPRPIADRERVHRLHVQIVHGLRLVRDDHAVHHTVVPVQREDPATEVEVTRVFPAGIRVERMPRRRLDDLTVNGQVDDLVVVVDERVDDGVIGDLSGEFIVDSVMWVSSHEK